MSHCFIVRGQVIIEGTTPPAPLPFATVELGLSRRGKLVVLERVTADSNGKFIFKLTELERAPTDSHARYRVRVFHDEQPLTVHGDIAWRADIDPGPLVICATLPTSCADGVTLPTVANNEIHGVIKHTDGTALNGLKVEIREVSLTGEELVTGGSVTTATVSGTEGFYKAAINPTVGTRLVVKVLESGTPDRLLASSRLLTVASDGGSGILLPTVHVDVCDDQYRRSSEYGRIFGVVDPLLTAGSVLAKDLTLQQIAFLSGRTDWDVERLTLFCVAHRLQNLINTTVSPNPNVSAEPLYGLLRLGYPTVSRRFLSRPVSGIPAALDTAAARNLIVLAQSTQAVADALAQAIQDAFLAQLQSTTEHDSLRAILGHSNNPVLSSTQLDDLIATYVDFYQGTQTGDAEAFWTAVDNLASFPTTPPDPVLEAKRMVTLGILALSYAPLVGEIIALIGTNGAAQTAQITLAQWQTAVDNVESSPGLPDGLPGSTPTAQKAALVTLLQENVALLFPSATARQDLLTAFSGTGALVDFLNLNPGFDFGRSRVDDFSGTTAEKAEAKKAQRLYRIAPALTRGSSIKALLDANITSAHQIARMGHSPFLSAVSGTLSADEASEVFRKARAMQGLTLGFWAQAHPNTSLQPFSFLPGETGGFDTSTLPDWETLFGNADTCQCVHCRSVLSPAAYLVDLLMWLDARGIYSTELTDRRADIGALQLTCDNTHTPLPTIDLVIEALEDAVDTGTAGAPISTSAAHDTTVTPGALLATPEHRNDAAYTALASATTALQLPFHRPLMEMETFLGMFELSRAALLDTFSAPGAPLDIARLQTSQATLDTITADSTSTAEEEAFWQVSALSDLESVRTFRRLTETTWSDILDLLHTRHLSGDLDVTATDWCDLDTFEFVQTGTSTAPVFSDWRLARQFIRLQRVTGFSPLLQDKVLHALGVSSLTGSGVPSWATDLANLAHLHQLTEHPILSLVMVVSSTGLDVFDDRDTKDTPEPSLYDQTFLSPSLFSADDAEYTVFSDLKAAASTDTLAAHASTIATALGVSTDELTALATAADLDLAVDALTLARLHTLYAWRVVGQATGLMAADTHALCQMLFGATHTLPASTTEFVTLVETAQELARAGWSLDTVRYLILGEQGERVGLSEGYLQTLLGELRAFVRQRFDDLSATDTEGTILDDIAQFLAEKFEVETAALTDFRGVSWPSGVAHEPGVFTLAQDVPFSTASPTSPHALQSDLQATADNAGTVQVGPDSIAITTGDVLTVLATSSSVTLPAGSYAARQGSQWTRTTVSTLNLADATLTSDSASPVLITLNNTTQVRLVDGRVGTVTSPFNVTFGPIDFQLSGDIVVTFGWSPDLTGDLLYQLRRQDYSHTDDDASSNPHADIVAGSAYEDDFALIRLLGRFLLLQKTLNLSEDERGFWLAGTFTELLDAADLSITSPTPTQAQTHFAGLKALIDLFLQRDRIPGTEPDFVTLLQSANNDEFADNLSERADWTRSEIVALLGQAGVNYTSVSGLRTLLERIEMMVTVGGTADTVSGWAVASGSVTAALSGQVVSAARAKYDNDDAWGAAARPFRDRMRKAQRDALVSHLLALNGFEDADELYEYYLIDVSMNPEMMTSRVKQASLAVQLFIHRIMMGLEVDGSSNPIYSASAEDREQWEWMRAYRVWEAARKVFLYPENWIEPELRDDKTPMFEKLEQSLAQGDVTDDRVEQVALDYLDQLHEVANLQVLACHWQHETFDSPVADDLAVFHVFARTRSEPATYWYRRQADRSRWSPWEAVSCGVQGSHLVPFIYGRRLMLFWAEFSEESVDEDTEWSVRLAWSTYRDGTWAPKRVMEDTHATGYGSDRSTKRFSLVAAEDDDGNLQIDLLILVDEHHKLDISDQRLASFVLDACTLQASITNDTQTQSVTRVGANDSRWTNPGFLASSSLTVYLAATDEDGALPPVATLAQVPLLGESLDATVVTPAQYEDFVSQSPFFVQTDRQCWFVDPGEDLETPSTELVEVDSPSVADLLAFRQGTWVQPASPTYTPTAPDLIANEFAHYTTQSVNRTVRSGAASLTQADQVLVDFQDSGAYTGSASGAYHFSAFYHPLVCSFIKAVRRGGIFALLDPDPDGPESVLSRQQEAGTFVFETEMVPNPDTVDPDYPVEDIDFSQTGAYAQYNWELFFHLPLYVANQLSTNARYEDALRWFHTIFDPRVPESEATDLGLDASSRWWKVKPLMEPVSAPVTDWVSFTGASGDAAAQAEFEAQVEAWRQDPFSPHALARLRPGTYQKVVVMKYLDNLIAWGDQLFTRDTLESLNEATQVYVYARQLLGDRPESLASKTAVVSKSFSELLSEGTLDDFGNVTLENAFTHDAPGRGPGRTGVSFCSSVPVPYFCVPHNAELLSYWDTIADRLFKIRNGLNINGVARSLALFEPPIDPAMLVSAAASGLDISAVLSESGAGLPLYRFSVMHGRAMALAGSVRALGNAMMSAMERRDAEELALLRQSQEGVLLDAVGMVREQQVAEAQENLEALKKSKATIEARHDYYADLIEKGWLGKEVAASILNGTADLLTVISGNLEAIKAGAGAIPNITAGLTGVTVETGGGMIRGILDGLAGSAGSFAVHSRGVASYLTTTAAYQRREDEWKFQRTLARKELLQIDKSLSAAEIRVEIAQREQRNHALQVEQSAAVLSWMESKYTHQELYDWMVSQLAELYFQTYQLAVSTAKKAEQCYQHELGRDDTFVQSTYWDSLRKGLMAGERLMADLERMDLSYLDNDIREFELTKHVSISRLDPVALERLRTEGECWVEVPEALFDLDCPGHYFRRIRSVAVTVACVSGAQRQVNLQLTLHNSRIRATATAGDDATLESHSDYPAIVTSAAVEDPGVFSADPREGRYLPFERRGAVADWHLRFCNQQLRQFDWSSISDVVLHLRYTARDGGDNFRSAVLSGLTGSSGTLASIAGGYTDSGTTAQSAGLLATVLASRDAPDELYQARNQPSATLEVTFGEDRKPYFLTGQTVQITAVYVIAESGALPASSDVSLDGGSTTVTLGAAAIYDGGSGGMAVWKASASLASWPDTAQVILATGNDWSALEDATIILAYQVD